MTTTPTRRDGNRSPLRAGQEPSQQLALFTQLQQIVVQLSQISADERRKRADLEKKLGEYAQLTQQQDRMIEELKASTRSLIAERDMLLEMQTVEKKARETESQHGSSADGLPASTRTLIDQLRREKRERIAAEEQGNKMYQEQQRTIDRLEQRIKQLSVAAGNTAHTPNRQPQFGQQSSPDGSSGTATRQPMSREDMAFLQEGQQRHRITAAQRKPQAAGIGLTHSTGAAHHQLGAPPVPPPLALTRSPPATQKYLGPSYR